MKNISFYIIFIILLTGCVEEVLTEEVDTISLEKGQADFLKKENANGFLLTTVENARIPPTVTEDFIWGINGHLSGYPDYTWSGSADLQADLIKELQLDFYRVNVKTDSNGNLIDPAPFTNILTASLGHFKLLPVFQLADFDETMNIQEAYSKGYSKAYGFASTHGSYIDYYMLGNERELKILRSGRDGSSTSDYYYQDFLVLASFFKGMISGINSADPKAKTIINAAGWKHWGYYELLEQEGVDYDIIGWQWYSDMGTMQEPLKVWQGGTDVFLYLYLQYQKPIWITEINRRKGSYDTSEEFQAWWIRNFINHLHNRDYVKAFFVYELFDEDHLGPNEPEAYYGLIKWNVPQTNNFKYKPAFKSYKFKIEETEFGYEDYIYSLYLYVDMREEGFNDPQGIAYWVDEFKNLNNLSDLLDLFLPAAGYEHFIEEQYNHLLDRDSDPTGMNYWISEMGNGVSRENVIAKFCSGSQFWSLSGSNNVGFLERLYQKLHGRELDEDAKNYFLDQLNHGVSRELIVKEILSSREYLRNFIDKQYILLLRRQSDPEGLDYWYNKMSHGLSQQGLRKEFLMSKQFWNKAIEEGYERRTIYSF